MPAVPVRHGRQQAAPENAAFDHLIIGVAAATLGDSRAG
jgi:hypothetical protein